ncbi:MAG: Nif3-like dinuclear metal center hexameric protein [Magnetococcales bacterium]|nr:Nif3-like dinuclear metal center hexameric protein [Magnetococcales bacterium]
MATTIKILEKYLHKELNVDSFSDYCPNGVQVLGRGQIKRVMTGVTASQELLKAAIAWQADLLLVHHGILWDRDSRVVKGSYKKRLQMLLANDLNLMAFHLPLDAHPVFGNNAQILNKLDLIKPAPFGRYKGGTISFCGSTTKAISMADFTKKVKKCFAGSPLSLAFGPKNIKKVAICSGGAPELIREAKEEGADLFITGEAAEFVYHFAKEEKINFIAAGHHRTEMFGVMALGEHIAEKYNIEHKFHNVANPI